MTTDLRFMHDPWDLWPSVTELYREGQVVGHQLLVAGRLFDIVVTFGPNRPARCPDTHPRAGESIVCALTPGHDGPHVGANFAYIEERQFVITGMSTVRSRSQVPKRSQSGRGGDRG